MQKAGMWPLMPRRSVAWQGCAQCKVIQSTSLVGCSCNCCQTGGHWHQGMACKAQKGCTTAAALTQANWLQDLPQPCAPANQNHTPCCVCSVGAAVHPAQTWVGSMALQVAGVQIRLAIMFERFKHSNTTVQAGPAVLGATVSCHWS